MYIIENRNKMDKGKHIDPDDDEDEGENGKKFKSKNLNAERRRRKKLNDRQLELRSLVPIITNMNKASIITDAITYIEELKNTVEELTHQLHQMEAISIDDDQEPIKFEEIDSEPEMQQQQQQPEVEVKHICETKLWIKIVFKKKKGGLTKLIEAIDVIGFDLTDTSITTSRRAVLFTSSAQGIDGGVMDADQIKKLLLEIIKSF
ncbi:transcription factor dysfunctional tapetum 1 [Phtheirospermum japonicum]|uniref:Transcription factor dysfunctional tapetum 1 n=1 Tax=Phtheirospermum japonicum TaxID=374723 RepID=A0A830BJ42_9LAMI|nr:transcription factor dysfunctional tapetum 1 [Phtheirospermum japonicum]